MELNLQFIFLTLALISNTPNVLGRQSVLTPVVCSQAGAVLYNGNCYQAFSDRALTWNEAQLACKTWGGDLATIDSDALAYAVIPNWYSLSYWIGMKVIDGTWIWVYDNSAVNLASPELNNWADFGAHKPGYDCQSINDEGYGLYLQEKLCSSTSYYVCMGAQFFRVTTPCSREQTLHVVRIYDRLDNPAIASSPNGDQARYEDPSTESFGAIKVPATSAIETTTTTTTTVKTTTLSSKSKDKSKDIPEGCNGPNNGNESKDNKGKQD